MTNDAVAKTILDFTGAAESWEASATKLWDAATPSTAIPAAAEFCLIQAKKYRDAASFLTRAQALMANPHF